MTRYRNGATALFKQMPNFSAGLTGNTQSFDSENLYIQLFDIYCTNFQAVLCESTHAQLRSLDNCATKTFARCFVVLPSGRPKVSAFYMICKKKLTI